MKERFCEHCGHELREFDDYNNQVWNCPNDCDFEVASAKAMDGFFPDDNFEPTAPDMEYQGADDESYDDEDASPNPITDPTDAIWPSKAKSSKRKPVKAHQKKKSVKPIKTPKTLPDLD
jgi:hypothetical protein